MLKQSGLASIKNCKSSRESKLSNASFIDRAPEAVVANERHKQLAAEDAVQAITAQLQRLEGLH
jgi:valyl-tRNA synthetase